VPDWIITIVAILLMGLGLAGSILPVVPGTLLILLAALGHKLLATSSVSWWVFAVMVLIALLGQLTEVLAGVAGSKWLGGGKWGMIGALAGMVVGIFFSIPGLILGPFLGAILGELLIAQRGLGASTKSGAGAGMGFFLSLGIKVSSSLLIISIFLAFLFLAPVSAG